MMDVKKVDSPGEVVLYLEGIFNDYEFGVATKDESIKYTLELINELLNRKKSNDDE